MENSLDVTSQGHLWSAMVLFVTILPGGAKCPRPPPGGLTTYVLSQVGLREAPICCLNGQVGEVVGTSLKQSWSLAPPNYCPLGPVSCALSVSCRFKARQVYLHVYRSLPAVAKGDPGSGVRFVTIAMPADKKRPRALFTSISYL